MEHADRVDHVTGFAKDAIQKTNELLGERAAEARKAAHAGLNGQPPAPGKGPLAELTSGTFESRLTAVAGGLSTVIGAANAYNDLQQLAQDGDASHGADMVVHSTDALSGLKDLAEGLNGSGLDLPQPVKTMTEKLAGGALGNAIDTLGGVGSMVDGAMDLKTNAEAFSKDPDFGNTLGMEIGALKIAAGAGITSRTPQGIVYGEALALTAGGLEVVKDVYDANPAVKATVDKVGEVNQQWMGALYCATQGIPQEVSAGKATLPPTPAEGWGTYMATHTQAEVAQYYADHGVQAPGT
jgi:hypothetical protein